MKWLMTIILSTMLIKLTTSAFCNVEQHEDTSWTLIKCSNVNLLSQIQFNYIDTNNFKQVLSIVNSNITRLPPKGFTRFPNIDELWLTNNHIEKLQPGALEGLDNLQQMYLDENELTEVPEGVFTYRLDLLTFLHMADNKIERVSQNAFEGLETLNFLHLQNNRISKLENGTFKDLKKLRVLGLNDNLLPDFRDCDLFSNSTNGGDDRDLGHNLGFLYLAQNRITSFVVKNLKKLQWIDFSYNYLTFIEPDSFTNLLELATLDLSNNFITQIPAQSLRGNVKLENIYLYNNTVHTLGQGVFQDLFELVELNMNNNSLTEFHDFYLWGNSENVVNVSKNLRDIKLAYNSITSASVTNCKAVKNVYFEYNQLKQLKPDGFRDMPNMVELDFSHNFLTSLPKDLLRGAVSLQRLFLNSLPLTKLECGIFNPLKKLDLLGMAEDRLEEFNDCCLWGDPNNPTASCDNNLDNIFLDHNLISSISLTHSPKLEYVHLEFNKINCVRASNFGGMTALLNLDLSNNLIFEFASNSLKDSNSLKQLNLGSNKISELRPGTFSDHPNLYSLNISDNLLKEFKIEDLWKNSKNMLENLDLSKNSINTFSITNSKELTSLELSYNNLSYMRPGMFQNLNELVTLNISHNNIHRIQFGVFQSLSKLENLNLSYNRLKKFEHTLLSGKTNLINLDLSNNQIDSFKLEDLKEHLNNLSSISLVNNSFMCSKLAKLEYQLDKLNVELVAGDSFNVQNIRGIPCDNDEDYGYI